MDEASQGLLMFFGKALGELKMFLFCGLVEVPFFFA